MIALVFQVHEKATLVAAISVAVCSFSFCFGTSLCCFYFCWFRKTVRAPPPFDFFRWKLLTVR